MLIGFAGRRRSGKGEAATALVARGFRLVKFAGPLKAMLSAYLAYQGVDAATIAAMLEGELKELPSPYLGGRSPRYAMQTAGTEWGRDLMHPALWVEAAMRAAAQHTAVVIDDVRFPNEVAAIRAAGGRVYRIDRPALGEGDAHVSEAGIAELVVDGVIVNDAPSAEAFRDRVAGLFTD